VFDRVTALAIIDRAYDEQRLCAACGAPTVLRSNAGVVVLECADLGGAGIMARISDILTPHTRHVVIDVYEGIAA
jgi:hypothetical protein